MVGIKQAVAPSAAAASGNFSLTASDAIIPSITIWPTCIPQGPNSRAIDCAKARKHASLRRTRQIPRHPYAGRRAGKGSFRARAAASGARPPAPQGSGKCRALPNLAVDSRGHIRNRRSMLRTGVEDAYFDRRDFGLDPVEQRDHVTFVTGVARQSLCPVPSASITATSSPSGLILRLAGTAIRPSLANRRATAPPGASPAPTMTAAPSVML